MEVNTFTVLELLLVLFTNYARIHAAILLPHHQLDLLREKSDDIHSRTESSTETEQQQNKFSSLVDANFKPDPLYEVQHPYSDINLLHSFSHNQIDDKHSVFEPVTYIDHHIEYNSIFTDDEDQKTRGNSLDDTSSIVFRQRLGNNIVSNKSPVDLDEDLYLDLGPSDGSSPLNINLLNMPTHVQKKDTGSLVDHKNIPKTETSRYLYTTIPCTSSCRHGKHSNKPLRSVPDQITQPTKICSCRKKLIKSQSSLPMSQEDKVVRETLKDEPNFHFHQKKLHKRQATTADVVANENVVEEHGTVEEETAVQAEQGHETEVVEAESAIAGAAPAAAATPASSSGGLHSSLSELMNMNTLGEEPHGRVLPFLQFGRKLFGSLLKSRPGAVERIRAMRNNGFSRFNAFHRVLSSFGRVLIGRNVALHFSDIA